MGSILSFRHRLYMEPCRCVVVGDSINSDLGSTNLCTAYHRTLRPTRWSGWGGSGLENGSSLSGGIWNYINAGAVLPRGIYYTPSGGAGDVALWPCHFGDLPFASDYAVDTTLAVAYSDLTKTAEFVGGDWTASALTCKWMVYRSTGTTLGIPNVGTYTRRIPSGGSGSDTGSNAISNGYNILSQSLGALAERGDMLLDAASPNIVETGKNIYIMGWRKYRDELGLQMSFSGVGGSTVADHINAAYISDTAIAKYVELYNTNTVIFWLGQNDGTINDTWRTNYASLIQRWRAAVGSTFRCALVSQYQTSTSDAAKVLLMESYLRSIASGASDVAVISVGTRDSGYALNNSLLGDSVHPTAAGATYFGNLIHGLLSDALDTGRGRGRRRGRWM